MKDVFHTPEKMRVSGTKLFAAFQVVAIFVYQIFEHLDFLGSTVAGQPFEFLHRLKSISKQQKSLTPLKFNMEPENGGLEDDFPFQLGAF